ncbi:MAG: VOC family protein [Bdellovibrionales bacterium]|nr:VOC family protein [Bdellovibrionales bacterium]
MAQKLKLGFIFHLCNDVDAVRDFYLEVLGATIGSYEKDSWVDIDAGVKILFFKGDYEMPTVRDWAWQPGYSGGQGHLTSFSFSAENEEHFRKIFESAVQRKVPMQKEKPEWRRDSYWGLTLKDPMGHTLEIDFAPDTKPDSIEWR